MVEVPREPPAGSRPDPATDGPNSFSPVGTPEGGPAVGNLTGLNPAEAVPDQDTSDPDASPRKPDGGRPPT
jgi:hypothetical protein